MKAIHVVTLAVAVLALWSTLATAVPCDGSRGGKYTLVYAGQSNDAVCNAHSGDASMVIGRPPAGVTGETITLGTDPSFQDCELCRNRPVRDGRECELDTRYAAGSGDVTLTMRTALNAHTSDKSKGARFLTSYYKSGDEPNNGTKYRVIEHLETLGICRSATPSSPPAYFCKVCVCESSDCSNG